MNATRPETSSSGRHRTTTSEARPGACAPACARCCPATARGATACGWRPRDCPSQASNWSPVGVAKAEALAARHGVRLAAIVADVARWDWPEAAFDLVAWIFLHLPPADRAAATAGIGRGLAPGGLLVLECFTPAQQGRRSGGPKDQALLWSREVVEAEFPGLEILELTEGTVRLDEGPRHQGLAEVVRAVLRRPV